MKIEQLPLFFSAGIALSIFKLSSGASKDWIACTSFNGSSTNNNLSGQLHIRETDKIKTNISFSEIFGLPSDTLNAFDVKLNRPGLYRLRSIFLWKNKRMISKPITTIQ